MAVVVMSSWLYLIGLLGSQISLEGWFKISVLDCAQLCISSVSEAVTDDRRQLVEDGLSL